MVRWQPKQAADKWQAPIAPANGARRAPCTGAFKRRGHWCTSRAPDVSLRGVKQRGALSAKREEVPLGCNLVQAVTISSIVSHDSTGCCEITASLLGPCNDKSDGLSHRICTVKNLRLPLQRAYCPFPERSFSLRACFRCSFLSLLFRFRMAARSGGTIRNSEATPKMMESTMMKVLVRCQNGAIPTEIG